MNEQEFISTLAAIIGGKTAHAKAEAVFNAYGSPTELAKAEAEEIAARTGLTPAEAKRTAAAIELTRHFYRFSERKAKANDPAALFEVFAPLLVNRQQEQLAVCIMNAQHRPIKTEIIYKGTQDGQMVRISELFKLAITCNAYAIAVAHNHPTGDITESPEDVELTRDMVAAGKLLNIRVLDHLIIGSPYAYTSIRANRPDLWK